jgi:cyclophilin family peptidyl-prolyl cis-trans isomerase
VTNTPQHSRFTKFLVIALFTILVMVSGCAEIEPPVEHTIEIIDAQTGQPIANAAVTGEISLRHIVSTTTGQDGTATLVFDPEHLQLHQWAKISVEADGYPAVTTLTDLLESETATVIELGAVESAQATDTPEESDTGSEEPETDSAPDDPPAGEAEAESSEDVEDVPTPETDPANRALVDVPAQERADYYSGRPEMVIDPDKSYQANITTNKGDIVVSLNAEAAPEHVNNFVFLSNEGYYDGLTFHRVEPGFVIQGGDPLGDGQGGPGYTVPGEFSLKHIEGALAMARLPDQINPNRESSGSQFYITLAPTPFLDDQYSVFGQVESGMDVVKAIKIGDVIEQVTVSAN